MCEFNAVTPKHFCEQFHLPSALRLLNLLHNSPQSGNSLRKCRMLMHLDTKRVQFRKNRVTRFKELEAKELAQSRSTSISSQCAKYIRARSSDIVVVAFLALFWVALSQAGGVPKTLIMKKTKTKSAMTSWKS